MDNARRLTIYFLMNNTCQLHQLMTLNATMNTTDIEERFEKIAKMLFESFAIQKGEKKYLFKEIEFYSSFGSVMQPSLI